MTVSENLAHARMAIDHVKKTLWLGSANKGKDYLPVWAGGKGGFNLAGVIAQRTFSPTSANAGPEKVAATAETYRSGNCDEKSAVAYVFLKSSVYARSTG